MCCGAELTLQTRSTPFSIKIMCHKLKVLLYMLNKLRLGVMGIIVLENEEEKSLSFD